MYKKVFLIIFYFENKEFIRWSWHDVGVFKIAYLVHWCTRARMLVSGRSG